MSNFYSFILLSIVSNKIFAFLYNDYAVQPNRPIVMSHRGYSSLFPENTLESYQAALYAGTDFIELDVQITKDGFLVISHDPYLDDATDVMEKSQFYYYREVKVMNGQIMDKFWIKNFYLHEIKKLGVKQRLIPNRPKQMNFKFQMPTLDEVIQLVIEFNDANKGVFNINNRLAGICIEAQDYWNQWVKFNPNITMKIYDMLQQFGIETKEKASKKAPIIFFAFDLAHIKKFKILTDIPVVYLHWNIHNQTHFDDLQKNATGIADAFGLKASLLLKENTFESTGFIEQLHQNGFLVYCYTFRDDVLNWGAQSNIQQNFIAQISQIDGIITEFPETTMAFFEIQDYNNNKSNSKKGSGH